MAVTDAERHRLHTKLDQVLGEEDAAVLISHLPPSGWSDVARTRDLDQLREYMDLRFEATEARFEASIERNARELHTRFLVTMGAMLTVFSAAQAVAIKLIAG